MIRRLFIVSLLLGIFAALAAVAHADTPHPLTGWKSNPHHAKGLQQLPRRAMPVPAAASLRDQMPPVYDQGNIGSCTANAGAGAFDYVWKLDTGSFIFPSRLDLYQNELRHDGNFPQDAGSYTSSILWVLQKQGVALEKCWPYVPANLAKTATACANQTRKNYKAVTAYDVPNDDNGRTIKDCLANRKIPVLTGGYVFTPIFTPIYDVGTRRWFVDMPKGKVQGGHEMLIVGYDDNLVIGKLKGFALVRNSWGTDWGDKGYAWFPYAYLFDPKWFEDNGAIQVTSGKKKTATSEPELPSRPELVMSSVLFPQ